AFTFDGDTLVGASIPPFIADAAFRIHSRPAGMVRPPALHPTGVLPPTPTLANAAAALAHVTVLLEQDGALRYDQTAIGFGGSYYSSLPIEAVRLYDGVAKEDAALHLGRGIALGSRFVETDRRMRLAVNHYGPAGTVETYSLVDLIRGAIPKGAFAGRIVLIAASARGVGDAFSTPFTQALPGAEHYATVIDNILTGRALSGHDRPTAVDAMAILLGGLAAALLGRVLPTVAGTVMVALLIAAWFAIAAHLFSTAHMWIAVAYPTAAAGLNFGIFAAARLATGRKVRRRIDRQRANLARYFSPAVAERLMDSDRPGLADRTQHAAILFVDLVGFTATSERLAPAEAMDLLRRFYRLVETAVQERGGVVDKFLGDGALAVFGIPEPSADDACNALFAARRLANGIAEWRAERLAADEPSLAVGIGLHYGPVLVGDAGGERQFSFTVIGDTVNTASRLEGLTRELGVTIVASDALMDAARATGGRKAAEGFSPLPLQRLRGRQRPIGVWGLPEPVTDDPGRGVPDDIAAFPDK
ncbi:MAG TPA: adenylate/guanylate cyclase domain-containing protein, partial [Alphaproteobacteria bacterium]|nr:adenylate/guanylate cyclase domain-containing protein [Alphaproteobacteria bacterium]